MSGKNNNFQFSISRIITKEFSTFESVDIEIKKVKLKAEINFAIDPINRVLLCSVAFEFYSADSVFIKIAIDTFFEIDEKTWEALNHEESKQLEIPKEFLRSILAISVGTCRGILNQKLEGSKFEDVILPIVDLSDMVTEDGIFEIPA